jgi:hypothetical protein
MTTVITANPDEKANFLTPNEDGSISVSLHTIVAWVVEYNNGAWTAEPVFSIVVPKGTKVIPLASRGSVPIPYSKEQLNRKIS